MRIRFANWSTRASEGVIVEKICENFSGVHLVFLFGERLRIVFSEENFGW